LEDIGYLSSFGKLELKEGVDSLGNGIGLLDLGFEGDGGV
jgi:hypothetical protein